MEVKSDGYLNPSKLIKKILAHISKRRKKQLLIYLLVTLISSSLEVFAIGSIIPFLVVIDAPQKVLEIQIIKNIYLLFDITTDSKIILLTTLLFCTGAFFSGLLKGLSLFLNCKISAAIGNDISKEVYRKTIYQSYEYHLEQNSSRLISIISTKIGYFITVLQLFLQMILSLITSIFIISFLLIYNFQITSLLIIIFPLIYLLITYLVRKRLKWIGIQLSRYNNLLIKTVQENISLIKEIIMTGRPDFYYSTFGKTDRFIRQRFVENTIISQTPKYLFETFGIIFLGLLAYSLISNNTSDNTSNYITLLGTFALAAQKILPLLQSIYFSFNRIKSFSPSVNDVLEIISLKIPIREKLQPKSIFNFRKEIQISNISYKYKNDKTKIIDNLSLTINAGECIGIRGKSGTGKSTLLNIISGLIPPSNGSINVDGFDLYDIKNIDKLISWRMAVSYVSQEFSLIDDTIAKNIVLNSQLNDPKINLKRLYQASKKAQINNFIESLPLGFNTIIGEKGGMLSGGQKQRIALARAFYKNSKILILDEATSALDSNSEAFIADTIKKIKGKITIIIVAHRKSNLSLCDKVYTLSSTKET